MHLLAQCPILQNGLHVNEILIFSSFKLMEKNTYVLSNYACHNQNISNFKYEVGLNTILTQSISNILSTYFSNTKVAKILYPTSHKPNAMTFFFIFLIYFLVSISKIVSFLSWILGGPFLFIFSLYLVDTWYRVCLSKWRWGNKIVTLATLSKLTRARFFSMCGLTTHVKKKLIG